MKTLPIVAVALLTGSLLLTGCSSATNPNNQVTKSNTDPKLGPVTVYDRYDSLLYTKICDGPNLVFANPYRGGVATIANSAECAE
jgi:hypothetical protein